MLGLIRLLPPCFCPPIPFGWRYPGECVSARKAVHNSPRSSEANLRWQNRSHISRRTEEGPSRGAERLFCEHCYPQVSATSREPTLSAFRVFHGFSREFVVRQPVADSLLFAEIIRGPNVNPTVTFGPRISLEQTLCLSHQRLPTG